MARSFSVCIFHYRLQFNESFQKPQVPYIFSIFILRVSYVYPTCILRISYVYGTYLHAIGMRKVVCYLPIFLRCKSGEEEV